MPSPKKPAEPEPVPNQLPIALIEHGNNPRTQAEGAKFIALTDSVRQHGVLLPIRVRPMPGERYEIIAGHRRVEAAREVGLTFVPALIAPETSDEDAYVQSLVENLEREDLDPIDEARAFKVTLEKTGWTQAELGKKIGRTQPQISNSLALLNLDEGVQKQLSEGQITVGHAKVLAYLPAEQQVSMATDVVERKLTVRDVEAQASRQKADLEVKAKRAEAVARDAKLVDAVLTEDKVKPDIIVVVYDGEIAAALRAAPYSWANARAVSWKTDTSNPTWVCDCTAVWVTPPSFRPDDQRPPVVKRCCTNKAHERAARAEADADLKAKAKAAENLLTRQRRAAVSGMKAIDADAVTEDGLRICLYTMLMKDESGPGEYGRLRQSFVKRHGGTWLENPLDTGEAVWLAIEGLIASDLVTEVLEAAVNFIVPNVFTQTRSANRIHAPARAWLVNELKLDPTIVWGLPAEDTEDGPALAVVPALTPAEVADDMIAISDAETEVTISKEDDTMLKSLADAGLATEATPATPEELVAEAGPPVDPEPTPVEPAPSDRPLEGERVAVTGVMPGYDRPDTVNLVINAGGYFAETVTKTTTLLVIGDKPGASKLTKAKSFGITTMTAADFLARIGGG